jgi:hypothetical protein
VKKTLKTWNHKTVRNVAFHNVKFPMKMLKAAYPSEFGSNILNSLINLFRKKKASYLCLIKERKGKLTMQSEGLTTGLLILFIGTSNNKEINQIIIKPFFHITKELKSVRL